MPGLLPALDSIRQRGFVLPSRTILPSTPAVKRPALSSVTRRTASSVFDRDRSINFCRIPDPFMVLCLRSREDPLSQTPYVFLASTPVPIAASTSRR
jgi:hypothetical protein